MDPVNRTPQSRSFFSGYTRLCKGLALVLVAGHALLQLFPFTVSYLALIPTRTIPFAWNLVTSGYMEQTLPGVIISVVGLLFIGKFLEPLWGSREFFRFIVVVNFLISICIFVTAIALYYITTEESYLYTPVSGFHGILAGFLVGIKQLMPDHELSLFFLLKIRAKWIPTLIATVSVAVSFFVPESASYLPTVLFGFYMGWLYLRYFQTKPETGLKGDPSDEFSFSSFFPQFLRPILDPVASLFDKMLCGKRLHKLSESSSLVLKGNPLPGSDPIDASRRRERGARALEQRLADERVDAAAVDGKKEGAAHGDASEIV
ncbi:rhomboid-like protein 19 isoform X2 [Phalaenopsis equestris]|uniref:rhomboid-like protein 19 isoform X2 n=1 Tax=Phalaenopsis equestris TaxID=78828 RepID=UPI0009E236C7|nr:rhomboid-like protein 19 isoform X2 [Phalaenopsis equestris]